MLVHIHIWKALAHGRWCHKVCETFITAQKARCKEKYFTKARWEQCHEGINPDRWYKTFDSPDVFKKRFTQWYGRQTALQYYKEFGASHWVSLHQVEQVAREFRWHAKKWTHTGNNPSEISDTSDIPPAVDKWGRVYNECHSFPKSFYSPLPSARIEVWGLTRRPHAQRLDTCHEIWHGHLLG